jgi:ABC-type transport system substrate-binding protein
MVFAANPHYYQGPPATPNIVVRFVWYKNPKWVAELLTAGEIDVVGWDTLFPDEQMLLPLLEAQAAGQARVYLMPSGTWEHIDFALFVK